MEYLQFGRAILTIVRDTKQERAAPMMSAVVTARILPFLLLVGWVQLSESAPNAVPEFTDLDQVFGDVCGYALTGEYQDNQFDATSHLPDHEAFQARFNKGMAGWMPTINDVGQWIQVGLSSTIYVTAILTQGSPSQSFYVTEYKIEYGTNAERLSCVLDMHSQPKIYEGNVDNSTPKINDFRPAISTNYIRVFPLKWEGAIAMRLEIFGGGCEECWQK